MPARSNTPGLIVIKRKTGYALYWAAKSLSRDTEGFPDKLVRIPPGATQDEIIDVCEKQTARFQAWLFGNRTPLYPTATIAECCEAFERHPHSPMQEVKANTAGSYMDSLKILRNTVGHHQVRSVTPVLVKEWWSEWAAPVAEGAPERLKRAHDAVSMLRAVLGFAFALGDKRAGDLREQLSALRFKRSGRRSSAMTYQQALTFIAKAQELGRFYMAVGVAAQFETMLRQKDVIGEYQADGTWRGALTWENAPGWLVSLKTSKNKAAITFDLAKMELLYPLLQLVPQEERTGAIVKGPTGAPMKERTYRKWFREIADAAGLPRSVWNMDSRAGAVTEALEAGAPIEKVARAATHARSVMTQGYDRGVTETVVEIAEARQAKRRVK